MLCRQHVSSSEHALIGPISYLGACYTPTKVTKYIRKKTTLYFRG